MLLAVDVGNSNTSLGVFEGRQLRCEMHLSTRRNWTRDELAVAVQQVLGLSGFSFAQIDAAAVACVVPPVLGPLVAALEQYTEVTPLVVGPGVKTGMPVRYDPPQDVGGADAPDGDVLEVLETHTGRGGIPAYQALPGVFNVAAYERRYLAEIRYLDAQVKRLVDGLDALGSAPGVWLTSDHGEAFGEDDFFFTHGHSVALDQIRVPLLWRPPRPGSGTVVAQPVSLIDVAPTILRQASVEAPDSFQGQPLPVAGLPADAPVKRRPVFSESAHGVAIVAGRTYYARERDGDAAPDWIVRRTARLPSCGSQGGC